MNPKISETFFILDILPRKNEMPNSLSSLLLFMATNYPNFTSLNESNSGNGSSRSTFVKGKISLVLGCCFLVGLEVIFCDFPRHGLKYPLSSTSGR